MVLSGTSMTRGRFTVDLAGDVELIRLFNQLPDRVQKRVMRGAVSKVARRLVRDVKSAIDRVGAVETGTLKKSIGFRTLTARSGHIVAIIGPKSGYRQSVTKDNKGRTRRLSGKKLAAAEATGEKIQYRQPSRYAHLVEFGTDDTQPKPFMRIGYEAGQDIARATLRHDILIGIEREATKMAAKTGAT